MARSLDDARDDRVAVAGYVPSVRRPVVRIRDVLRSKWQHGQTNPKNQPTNVQCTHPVGSRTSAVDASDTDVYSANSLNQHTEVADVNYAYDAAGNMTSDGQG